MLEDWVFDNFMSLLYPHRYKYTAPMQFLLVLVFLTPRMHSDCTVLEANAATTLLPEM